MPELHESFVRLLDVWAFVVENEGTTISNIASKLGMNRGTLSKNLDALERLGVIKRVKVRGPPKRIEIHLTEKGKRVAKEVLAIHSVLKS